MLITKSQSRTASSLLAAADTSTPSASDIRAAKAARRCGSRLNALTAARSRTAATACNCVGACPPVPIIPTRTGPSLHKCLTATPLVAPVRSCPSRLACV